MTRRIPGAIALATVLLVLSAVPAEGSSFSHSVNAPLPGQPASYSVTVGGQTVYTPTLTNGQASLTASVSGEPGGLAFQSSGFSCPSSSNPKPVLNVLLGGASGDVGVNGGITGTTTDPRGGPNTVYQAVGFGPQPFSAPATSILTVCSS
jgi:hypothetical protein